MPQTLISDHDNIIGLEEVIAYLEEYGFDPKDEASITNAAYQLKGLYNDRDFLSDILIRELEDRCQTQNESNAYGGQSIILYNQQAIMIRANIWPGKDHYLMRKNGEAAFYFDTPHDHNFDFLTIGYMGPGYRSEYYEYDYEKVIGYKGEHVDLRYIETSCLEEGKILHYRAHKDVHQQLPARSLSVSINIMHQNMVQPWYDQYHFDLSTQKIVKILNHVSGEVLLQMAVHLLPEQGQALAHEYMHNHPCDRMRYSSFQAFLSVQSNENAAEMISKTAHSDSKFLRNIARNMLELSA